MEQHGGCPHHEAVQITLDRLTQHCNGTHVRMEQVTRCQEDVSALTQQVRDVCDAVAELKHSIAVDKAAGSKTLAIVVAAITAGGVIVNTLVTHFAK
jgi:phage-related tail protein